MDIEEILRGVPEGERHDSIFKMASRLRSDGKPLQDAIELALTAAANCKPPLPADEARETVESVYARYAVGRPPRTSSSRADRPKVSLAAGAEGRVIGEIEAILARPEVGIFSRAGHLVEVHRLEPSSEHGATPVSREPGAPVIKDLTLFRFWRVAAENIAFEKFDDRPFCRKPCAPPEKPLRAILETGGVGGGFRRLTGVIETPTLRGDGSVISEPGYDEATGLLYLPGERFPAIPDNPDQDDAVRALKSLAEPFAQFPYVSESDRSAAVSAVVTAVCREVVDGSTPFYGFRAPTPGSGKTLEADIVSIIGTGRNAPRFPPAEKDEEERKRLLALALAGDRIALIDNVEAAFGSAALAGALTSGEIRDRVLGRSEVVTAPFRVLVLVTGNNLVVKGDLARRMVPVDIDPKIEAPEERSDFTYPDLRARVRAERGNLVAAALTVVRAYILAGRPKMSLPPMGSFEAWSDTIRSAIVWGGMPDPAAGRVRVRTDSDPDLEALRGLLLAWSCAFKTAAVSASQAVSRASGDEPNILLKEALQAIATRGESMPSPKTVAAKLRRWKDRIVDGQRFEKGPPDLTHSAQWRVVRVSWNG